MVCFSITPAHRLLERGRRLGWVSWEGRELGRFHCPWSALPGADTLNLRAGICFERQRRAFLHLSSGGRGGGKTFRSGFENTSINALPPRVSPGAGALGFFTPLFYFVL